MVKTTFGEAMTWSEGWTPKLVNCCRLEREWSTGSSTSSGEEDKRDAEIKELRAQIELFQKRVEEQEAWRARATTGERKWIGGRVA